MTESQRERTTARGRAVVVAVVAAVVLAGAGAFVVSGAGATTGGSADWSPHPGKEVTPDDETCPVGYEQADNSSDDDDDDENDSDEDVNDSGYVLYITANASWTVNVTTEEETMSMDGEGNETIEEISAGENDSVRAAIAKTEATNGTVRINLTYDGEEIDTDEATNGVVSTGDSDRSDSTDAGGSSLNDDSEDWDQFNENNEATSSASGDDPFKGDNETDNSSSGSNSLTSEDESFGSGSFDTNDDSDTSDSTATSNSDYQIRVAYGGDWSGNVGTDGSSRSVDGSGTETIDIDAQEGDIVSANAQKDDDSSDELSVQILRDGDVIQQTNTTAEFGVATVTTSLNGSQSVISELNNDDTDSSDNETVNASDVPDDCVPVNNDEDDTNDSDNDTEDETIESNEENETIEVNDTAEVVFDRQEVPSGAVTLTVESATLPEGGFVVLYNRSMDIIGVSDNLSSGTTDGESIELNNLDNGIEENQQVTAVLYADSNDDEDFGTTSDPNDPGPDARYVYEDDETVGETASIEVEGSDETVEADSDSPFKINDNDTDNNAMSSPQSQAAAQTTQANAPGFGFGVAAVAMLAAALVAVRRQ
jgi:PGF-CTERM protein